ncbi:MAG TPA: CocE/NonD family hydrolase [Fontimonas sp.]
MNPISRRLLTLGFCSLLAACGTEDPVADGIDSPAVAKSIIFDGTIPAADGETIGITVYQPALAANQAAPLVIHGHGFGLSRNRNFEGSNPIGAFLGADVTSDAGRLAWNSGYYVISFDQRGFGQSSGPITVMDPEVDGRNVSTIIDWAEENLPHLARRGGDPVIGGVGLSYGGGFQLIGAGVDPRFDALVPTATWSDLRYSLAPGGVPKSIWLDILAAAGGATAGFQFEPFVYTALLQATLGTVSQDSYDRFYARSFASFCAGDRADGRGVPRVDAFFVQGANDVLFNMNEAAANLECLRAQGRDARLLVQTSGHISPALQAAGRQILFGVDEDITCGNRRYDTAAMMLDFLDEKLQRRVPGQQTPPDLCISLTPEEGLLLPFMPHGGEAVAFGATQVIPGAVGQVVDLLRSLPLQTLYANLTGLAPEALRLVSGVLLNPPGSDQGYTQDFLALLPQIVNLLPYETLQQLTAAPVYVPLHTATRAEALAGIPQATLRFAGGAGQPPLFAGLGLRKRGVSDPAAISDQVTPVRANGEVQLDLAGVRAALNPGDEIGLLLYGFHPYFLNNSILSLAPVPVTVSGEIALPLLSR